MVGERIQKEPKVGPIIAFQALNEPFRVGALVSTCSKTDRLLWERIWTTGVINKNLFLMEIEFIVARNAAKGFIPAKHSEAMVRLQGGDCHPTRRRGTKLGQ